MHRIYSLLSLFFACTFLVLFGVQSVAAQPRTPRTGDSTSTNDEWGEDWTLDSLNVEDFDFDAEQVYAYSSGWFPTPFNAASLSVFSGAFYNDVHDRATDLRTAAFVPTTEPFGWRDPYNCSAVGKFFGFECREKQILNKKGEPVEEGYPRTNYSEIGLRFLYHLPFPAILRAEGAYRISDGLLYSEDTSRAYLSLDGVPRSFREIGVLFHHQDVISGGIGLQIPVYGTFFDSDFISIGSYYYLFGQVAADYAVVAETTQYAQIADAKDHISFDNGQDTVTLMRPGAPASKNIERLRTSWEAGIGWGVSAEVFVFGFEAFISVPFKSMVNDGDWKQYYTGLRFNVGYQWGTRSRSK